MVVCLALSTSLSFDELEAVEISQFTHPVDCIVAGLAFQTVSFKIHLDTVFEGSQTGVFLGKSESDPTLNAETVFLAVLVTVRLILDTDSEFGGQMEANFTLKTLLGGLLNLGTVLDDTDIILLDVRISTLLASFKVVGLASNDDTAFLVFWVSDKGEVA